MVEGVDEDVGRVCCGEGEAEKGRSLRRRYLCRHVVVGQIYLIIIGRGRFCLVGEPAGTTVFVEIHLANSRHDGKLAVVVDPRAGLVGLLETAQFVGRIGVCPAVAHLSCLRSPEVHTPRHSHSRIGITRRKRVLRLRSDKRADVVNWLVGLGSACTHGSECEHGGE